MRTARLLAAVSVAVIAQALTPRASWSRIKAAWKLLSTPHERADFWTVYRRYRCCKKCPVFYKPLRTCGSPLNKEFRRLGCYCSMENKSGLKSASCWADDNLGADSNFGWISHTSRAKLNP